MSVEKFNPLISGEIVPYTQVNTQVIQNIDNIEAGFIWVYLLTLPKDWTVVKAHIKNKFNLGDNKIKRVFAYLKRSKLIEYITERDELGRLKKTEIRVLNGSKFNALSTGMKIHPVVNQTSGKQATTNNIKNKQNKRTNIGPTKIDDNFMPNTAHVKLASELRISITEEISKFIDHFKATAKKYKDWNAAFNNWLRRAAEYKPKKKERLRNTLNDEIKSTVPFFGPGHPSYDALHGVKINDSQTHGSDKTTSNTRGNGVRKVTDYLF